MNAKQTRQRARLVREFSGELEGILASVAGQIRRMTKAQLSVEAAVAAADKIQGPLRQAILNGSTAGANLGVAAGSTILETMIGTDVMTDAALLTANEHAMAWAANNAGTKITMVQAHTVRSVRTATAAAIEGGLTPYQLADRLADVETGSGVLGKKRALLIASTETTEAYASGNLEAWTASGVVESVGWRTSNDEAVCPICAPLGGLEYQPGRKGGSTKPGTIGKQEANAAVTSLSDPNFVHPGGKGAARRFRGQTYRKPPAHPGCRCTLVPIIVGVDAPAAKPPKPKPKGPSLPPLPADGAKTFADDLAAPYRDPNLDGIGRWELQNRRQQAMRERADFVPDDVIMGGPGAPSGPGRGMRFGNQAQINHKQRAGETLTEAEEAMHRDRRNLMKASDQEETIYRGLSLDEDELAKWQTGNNMQTGAIESYSQDIAMPVGWLEDSALDRRVIVKARVQKGTKRATLNAESLETQFDADSRVIVRRVTRLDRETSPTTQFGRSEAPLGQFIRAIIEVDVLPPAP